LYYLLTGRPPFRGESANAVLSQVLLEKPIPPRQVNPQVPVELEAICLKCLEKDPARRYASAAALAEALRVASAEPALELSPPGPRAEAPTPTVPQAESLCGTLRPSGPTD